MICPWCGAEVAQGQFCENCGSPLYGGGASQVQDGFQGHPSSAEVQPQGFSSASPFGAAPIGQELIASGSMSGVQAYGQDAAYQSEAAAVPMVVPYDVATMGIPVIAPYEPEPYEPAPMEPEPYEPAPYEAVPAMAPYEVATVAPAAIPFEAASAAPAPYEVASSAPVQASLETMPSDGSVSYGEAQAIAPAVAPYEVASQIPEAAPYEGVNSGSMPVAAAPYEVAAPAHAVAPYEVASPAPAVAPYEIAPAAPTPAYEVSGESQLAGLDEAPPQSYARAPYATASSSEAPAPYGVTPADQVLDQSGVLGWGVAPNTAFGLAIAGLVLSLLAVTFVPGIICSIIALVLNGRYNKSGLYNRHKTSTFVMGVIGLVAGIASAVALAYFLLFAKSVVTEIEEQSAVGSSFVQDGTELSNASPEARQAFEGSWLLVSMSDDEEAYSEEDIAALAEKGRTVELNLLENGTAELVLFGATTEGTWVADSESHATCSMEGDSIPLTLEDGTLEMQQGSDVLVFERAS